MPTAAIERQEAIALRWMELVAAGQRQSAEAQALSAEFAALDRLASGRQTADGGNQKNAACAESPARTAPPDILPATRRRSAAKQVEPRSLFPRPRGPGRRRVLSEFRQGQLAALLAVGIPLRESARWLQISRSTAQRAKADRRLQAEAAALAQQMQNSLGFTNGPKSTA